MSLVAFNRYILVCHKNLYEKIFTHFTTVLYCLLCWMTGILDEIGSVGFLGWNANSYDTKSLTCNWNRLSNRIYSLV